MINLMDALYLGTSLGFMILVCTLYLRLRTVEDRMLAVAKNLLDLRARLGMLHIVPREPYQWDIDHDRNVH